MCFLTGDFFGGCIFVFIFGVDCIVLIFCPLHCIGFFWGGGCLLCFFGGEGVWVVILGVFFGLFLFLLLLFHFFI